MKVYDAASIRNIAIVGHGGSGKTQLASSILFNTGMVNRLGKVDEGNTVTDFDEEEIARKHTLSASLAFAEWNKVKINVIDTPGFANFFSDARAALRVADGALVLVDAVSGPEVQTEKAWEECEANGLPRLVVFSRMDRDRSSLERTLESVQATFGRAVVPIQMPIGEEKNFKGVVDLVAMKAYTWAGDGSAEGDRDAGPRRPGRQGDRRPRRPDRDGRRGRRQPDGEVLRGRHADARTSSCRACAPASRRPGSSPPSAPPGWPTSASSRCSTPCSPICRPRPSGS